MKFHSDYVGYVHITRASIVFVSCKRARFQFTCCGSTYRSAQNCGVIFISNGPQLVGHSPDLQLACCPFPGGSVLACGPGWVLALGQQVRQRSLSTVGLLVLLYVRVYGTQERISQLNKVLSNTFFKPQFLFVSDPHSLLREEIVMYRETERLNWRHRASNLA